MSIRRKPVLCALAALGLLAAPALAADREATLSSSATKFEWEGEPQVSRGAPLYVQEARTAIPCGSPVARPCEETLLELAEDGKLAIKVEGTEGTGGTTDVDLYVYASDASGAPGELLGSSAENGPDTVTVTKAKAGHYLAVADYYHSYDSAYTGAATFTPAAQPVAPPPAPAPAPAPEPPAGGQASKKPPSKAAACRKKAKKIKNAKKRRKALKRCKRKR